MNTKILLSFGILLASVMAVATNGQSPFELLAQVSSGAGAGAVSAPVYTVTQPREIRQGGNYAFIARITRARPNAEVVFYLQRPDGALKYGPEDDVLAKIANRKTNRQGNWISPQIVQVIDSAAPIGVYTSWVTVAGIESNKVTHELLLPKAELRAFEGEVGANGVAALGIKAANVFQFKLRLTCPSGVSVRNVDEPSGSDLCNVEQAFPGNLTGLSLELKNESRTIKQVTARLSANDEKDKVVGIKVLRLRVLALGASPVSPVVPPIVASTSPSTIGNLLVALDVSTPSTRLTAGGAADVPLTVLKLTAIGEEIRMQSLALQLDASNPAAVAKVSVWDGATKVGELFFTGANPLNQAVAFVTPVIIPRDGDKLLIIKADIAQVGTSRPARAGDTVAVNFDADSPSTRGIGQTSSSTVVRSSELRDTTAAPVRVFRSYPTLARSSVPTNTPSNGTMVLYRFSVSAPAAGDVSLGKVAFQIQSALVQISRPALYAYTDSGYSIQAYNSNPLNFPLSSAVLATTSEVEVYFNPVVQVQNVREAIVVPAGMTRYFELRAAINQLQRSAGGGFAVALLGDADTVPVAQLYLVNQSEHNDFIWSGNSTTTGTYHTNWNDWTSGYALPGLPSSQMERQSFGFIETPPDDPGSLVISPSSVSGVVGRTYQLQALYDADGPNGPVAEQTVTNLASWSSSDTSIVTVNNAAQKGLATATSAGSAAIAATFADSYGNTLYATANILVNFPSQESNLNLGAIPVRVIVVNLDETGTDRFIQANLAGVNQSIQQLNTFVQQSSYGKARLAWSTSGVYDLGVGVCNRVSHGDKVNNLIQRALQVADSESPLADYSYYIIVHKAPRCADGQPWTFEGRGAFFEYTLNGRVVHLRGMHISDVPDWYFIHEFGHSLAYQPNTGIGHPGYLNCPIASNDGEVQIALSNACSQIYDFYRGRVPVFTIMSAALGIFSDYSVMEKEIAGWLTGLDIVTTTAGQYTLSPIEQIGPAPKALKIPIAGTGYTVYVSFRQPIGYTYPAAPADRPNGVIFDVTNGPKNFLVTSSRNMNAPLQIGMPYRITADGPVITVNNILNNLATVTVSQGMAATSTATFSTTSPAITILSPNGGEVIRRGNDAFTGDNLMIKYEIKNVSSAVGEYGIYIASRNDSNFRLGPPHYYMGGASEITSGGISDVTTRINNTFSPGSYYALVEWKDKSGYYTYDASDSPFSIVAATTTATTTPTEPLSVDLKVNGLDGPVTVPYSASGISARLAWTSTGAASCTRNWGSPLRPSAELSGTFDAGGSLTEGFPRTYTLTCVDAAGASASDSVTVTARLSAALNVSLNASSPRSAVVNPGQSGVTFAQIKLDAASRAIGLRRVKVVSDSTGAIDALRNIQLVGGGGVVWTAETPSLVADGGGAVQWFNVPSFAIPPGYAKTLTIKADIAAGARGSLRLGVSAVEGGTTGSPVVDAEVAIPGGVVYGNLMTVRDETVRDPLTFSASETEVASGYVTRFAISADASRVSRLQLALRCSRNVNAPGAEGEQCGKTQTLTPTLDGYSLKFLNRTNTTQSVVATLRGYNSEGRLIATRLVTIRVKPIIETFSGPTESVPPGTEIVFRVSAHGAARYELTIPCAQNTLVFERTLSNRVCNVPIAVQGETNNPNVPEAFAFVTVTNLTAQEKRLTATLRALGNAGEVLASKSFAFMLQPNTEENIQLLKQALESIASRPTTGSTTPIEAGSSGGEGGGAGGDSGAAPGAFETSADRHLVASAIQAILEQVNELLSDIKSR